MVPTRTPNAPRGTIHGSSSSNIVKFTIRASPLPKAILNFVLQNVSIIKKLRHERRTQDSAEAQNKEEEQESDNYGEVARKPSVGLESFWEALQKVCEETGGEWADIIEQIWAFGPQKAGGCLLVDKRKSGIPFSSVLLLFCA